MTQEQIIDDTVNYYQGHPERFSGTKHISCLYRSDETGCAVGRCLTDETIEVILKNGWNSSTINDLKNDHLKPSNFNNFFKEEYRGQKISFWSHLQSLHDDFFSSTPSFWTEDAMLTERGKEMVKILKSSKY